MMTEVNMNVATYIKFDDISNALVEIRPTKLASLATSGTEPSTTIDNRQAGTTRNLPLQLDTSFNVALAFSSAIDKLNGGTGSLAGQLQQQTPALGEFFILFLPLLYFL